MKKTRKKGNLALRRRIRKTTASLFMILAIVVAMLPVENMKTTKAAARTDVEANLNAYFNQSASWGSIGSKESTDTTASASANYNSETFYTGSEVTLQRIESSYFMDVFKAKLDTSGKSAMITNYENTQLSNMEIYATEHYDYVEMNSTYIEAVADLLKDEQYTITFDDNTTSTTYGGANGLSQITVVQLKPNSYSYSIVNKASASSLSGSYENKYTELRAITEDTYVKNMFEGSSAVDTSVLSQAVTNVKNYNSNLNSYISQMNTIINKGTSVEASDIAEWDSIKTKIEDEYNSVKTTYKTLATISANANNDDLDDIVNYNACVCGLYIETNEQLGERIKESAKARLLGTIPGYTTLVNSFNQIVDSSVIDTSMPDYIRNTYGNEIDIVVI